MIERWRTTRRENEEKLGQEKKGHVIFFESSRVFFHRRRPVLLCNLIWRLHPTWTARSLTASSSSLPFGQSSSPPLAPLLQEIEDNNNHPTSSETQTLDMASTAILSDLHSVGDEDVQQHSALATVDIDLIEQHKENIQPLASGRSALQLAALSSQTRAGLGEKLSEEHTRFQTALAALDLFEHNKSVWDEGHLGLSGEQVAAMADDPLDIHHQYARFVLNSYPAGASSSSRLLPLLESSTRKFLDDERYTNDPRYLRLWNLYAKNMDCPEDCYRFLFAKGIGERLAILYEEYALVLESAGKYVASPTSV